MIQQKEQQIQAWDKQRKEGEEQSIAGEVEKEEEQSIAAVVGEESIVVEPEANHNISLLEQAPWHKLINDEIIVRNSRSENEAH